MSKPFHHDQSSLGGSKMASKITNKSLKQREEVESLILNATNTLNESQMPNRALIREIDNELDELT